MWQTFKMIGYRRRDTEAFMHLKNGAKKRAAADQHNVRQHHGRQFEREQPIEAGRAKMHEAKGDRLADDGES